VTFEPDGLPAISPFLSSDQRNTRFALANPFVPFVFLPKSPPRLVTYMPSHLCNILSIDFLL